MPSVNRAAVILKPRAPFLKWVNAADPQHTDDLTMEEILEEPTIYLVPEFNFTEEAAEWVKSAYHNLFESVLWDYYTDESVWPKNRTYEMFCRWFDYSVHSMVIDMADGPLIREQD